MQKLQDCRLDSTLQSNIEYSKCTNAHCLEKNLNHKKMGTLQFYTPGFQNDPSYPKQEEFLKSTEGISK